jgi:organic radical activating enzyme
MNLSISEIFYSLQGEGARQGEASIFVRLSQCNLQCSFCDADYSEKEKLSPTQILSQIQAYPCRWIVWTGGEPTLQLTDEILTLFQKHGYRQAIESNGHIRLSKILNYTVVSPKGPHIEYARKINPQVDEIRLPVENHMPIPALETLPEAKHYFLSPIFADASATAGNIRYCVEYIKAHPEWRLSLQIHKWIGIE